MMIWIELSQKLQNQKSPREMIASAKRKHSGGHDKGCEPLPFLHVALLLPFFHELLLHHYQSPTLYIWTRSHHLVFETTCISSRCFEELPQNAIGCAYVSLVITSINSQNQARSTEWN